MKVISAFFCLVLSLHGAFAAMEFTDVTRSAGIDHSYYHGENLHLNEYNKMTGGAVASDFDGDGWVDLYAQQGENSPNLLYLNNGDGSFREAAEAWHVDISGPQGGLAAADYDSDGDIDIVIARKDGPHFLLINNGVSRFFLNDTMLTHPRFDVSSPSWSDVNGDGLLDLILGSWSDSVGFNELAVYLNKGNGSLEIDSSIAQDWSLSPFLADFDGDRDQDLFMVADFGAAKLYENLGDGEFEFKQAFDVENGMGVDVGDYDQDGDLDVFVTSIRDMEDPNAIGWGSTGNRLYRNEGGLTFSDVTETAGVRDGYWGWGAAMVDLDNDADLDIYHVNGWAASSGSSESARDKFFDKPALLFENLGDGTFDSVAGSSGDAANRGQGRCLVVFDYDRDGDLDLFLTNNISVSEEDTLEPAAPVLLRNNLGNHNNWVQVLLEGASLPYHSHGIGARIELEMGTVTLVQELNASSRYFGHGEARRAHFGLGQADEVDLVRAIWINGNETVISDPSVNQAHTLQSPAGQVSSRTLIIGESLDATILDPEIPAGGEVIWSFEGETYSNPTTIEVGTAGVHWLEAQVLDSEGTHVRTERFPISVFSELPRVPVITEQPQRKILNPGDSLSLSVEVEGTPEPSIQWFHNGQELEGENGATLVIPVVDSSDAGKYWIVAENSEGAVYSSHARVSVRSLFADKSVARQWMEELLDAIRQDYPAPTVHSRNLFAVSAVMWDAWAAYESVDSVTPYLSVESPAIPDGEEALKAARNEAVSYAAYRVLRTRFRLSPSAETALNSFYDRMLMLGYDPQNKSMEGQSPAAVGNRIAARMLARAWVDGGNEKEAYADQTGYEPTNEPMIFELSGAEVADPNHWQPLTFDFRVTQNGIPVGASTQEFLGPNWGWMTPFALPPRGDPELDVHIDPGHPPYLYSGDRAEATEAELAADRDYKESALQVIEFTSWLDPSDPTVMDVSPSSGATPFPRHNNPLGDETGKDHYELGVGYNINPVTGLSYEANPVLRADYGRILAEFWADGPDSETPPGHWNSIANKVGDHPLFEKRLRGEGEILDDLEWDVKLYFALNGAVYDAAIACWDAKRKYDYVRPITMIRYMGGLGQSSDPNGLSYHPQGLPLRADLVEVVTDESALPGERHAHLAPYVGEIAVRSWNGIPENPNEEAGGVGWIRAVDWMPYQRDTFVTPPFGAYTSGHSTFSRAAAEVLASITGSAYFPGGESSFSVKAGEFLEFEFGPTEDLTLTWATYFDASDEAGISRLYGGIHVWPDDLRGRIMGSTIGQGAFEKAITYFEGTASSENWDTAFAAWADLVSEEPEEFSDTQAYFENPYGELERFFYGIAPFREGSSSDALQFKFDESMQAAECVFEMASTVAPSEVFLEESVDFLNWKTVDTKVLAMETSPLGQGKLEVRLRLEIEDPISQGRFYRVRVSEL